jgi:predicted nucleotidyltransferase
MIETLISSKTRIKLLLRFFLNEKSTAYLRGLETELGESTNAIRLELNKFEKAGLINFENQGNKKIFRANSAHPLYNDIHNILMKHIGVDRILDNVIAKLGQVEQVFLTGSFARGIDGPIIDLIIVGDVDREYLTSLCQKAEALISKKIRFIIFTASEFDIYLTQVRVQDILLLWALNESV